MAQTSGFDLTTQGKTCFDCKMFDAANWVARLNIENVPEGRLHIRPFQFYLKEHWCQSQTVLVATGNSTVVAYINKVEHTRRRCALSC